MPQKRKREKRKIQRGKKRKRKEKGEETRKDLQLALLCFFPNFAGYHCLT